MRIVLAFFLQILVGMEIATAGGQSADPDHAPKVATPAYPNHDGPLVGIDEAHNNFHTCDGRYRPFADLLRADGYRVEPLTAALSAGSLAGLGILVIANPLAAENVDNWSLPTPSAFRPDEIKALQAWVASGGSLLLVVDHMPFPGAAGDLAGAFGVRFENGFVMPEGRGKPTIFTRLAHTLRAHPVTDGGSRSVRIQAVATFTGSAFQAPESAQPLLVLPEGTVSLNPETAWKFETNTKQVLVGGWVQGASLEVGQGRLAVFGEAAMFTAQRTGPNRRPVGMNHPAASQNQDFLLNLVHWLDPQTRRPKPQAAPLEK